MRARPGTKVGPVGAHPQGGGTTRTLAGSVLDDRIHYTRSARFLKTQGTRFAIDEAKIAADARYDGKWVLRTNTGLAMDVVALAYRTRVRSESATARVASSVGRRRLEPQP
jgi:hypothetical protein